jgi:hypothetical protein
MKFQVVDRSANGKAEHAVLTECGKHVDSYRTAEEAKARATWLEAEYERMSEVL